MACRTALGVLQATNHTRAAPGATAPAGASCPHNAGQAVETQLALALQEAPPKLVRMRLSVAIVDDDPRLRCAVSHAVLSAPDMRLAGAADDLPSGRALIDREAPEVLLVGLALPSGSGIELIRHATQRVTGCNVLVLSRSDDERSVLACIAAGATGYLLKDTPELDLAEQIRVLHAGGSPVSPVITRRLLKRLVLSATGPAPAAPAVLPTPDLSRQELGVLLLSAKGHSYVEIAAVMGLSRLTVLTYVKRSYRKLQVHSKTEAVYEARRKGWLRD